MLFSGVKYVISSSFPEYRQDELAKVLEANGASKADLRTATHVITNSLRFEGHDKVAPHVAIVSDEWVDRSMVFGKQQETRLFSADPLMIFSGVIATTADIEPCDKEVIAAGINALGGLYREGYTRDCTHVLVSRPGSAKYDAAMHFREATRTRIVLPHWFDDCFKLLTRLDEAPYEWPDPPILQPRGEGPKNPKAHLTSEQKMLVEASRLADSRDEAKIAELVGTKKNIWHGRKILLSKDLALEKGRRQTVELSVRRAGGEVITLSSSLDDDALEAEEEHKLDDADVYVTQYRFGPGYMKALRTNRTIGTLAWLFNVHKTGVISRPQDQLLHYPYYKEPPEGFASHKITISNYSGEARDYIKKLIALMGAEFTPTMTAANTVVIAAYMGGNKTDKAREWSIPVVNHTWLEDSFVQWKNLTPAQQKYIHYPEGVNFGTIIGARGVGSIITEEEVEEVEAKMREERERKYAEAEKKRAEAEKRKLEEERRREEEKQQAEKQRRKDQVTEGVSPRGTMNSEREREASEVEEVDAAIDLVNGDDSQPVNSVDKDFDKRDQSRSPVKKAVQPKAGPSKQAKRGPIFSEPEEEEDEQPRRQATKTSAKVAPAKSSASKAKKRYAPSSEEDQDEDSDLPQRVTRSASRSGPSRLFNEPSPRTSGKKKAIELEEEEEEQEEQEEEEEEEEEEKAISQPKRGRGRPRKNFSTAGRVSSPDDVVEVRPKSAKGKGKSTLEELLDPLTDSDEGLTPIRSPRRPTKRTVNEIKGGRTRPHALRPEQLESEESEDGEPPPTKVGPPRKASKLVPTSSTTGTPQKTGSSQHLRKQVSMQGPKNKVPIVEIPSPPNAKKVGGAIKRTQSIVAAAADGASAYSTPKRGRPSRRERSPTSSRSSTSPEEEEPIPKRPPPPTAGLQRTPSKRQAATMASLRLHETAQDMNNFQKEMRTGVIRGPWEERGDKGRVKDEVTESKKRRASGASSVPPDTEDDVEEIDPREKKKRKVDASAAKTERKARTKRGSEENIPPPGTKRARFVPEASVEVVDPPQRNKKGKKEPSIDLESENVADYTVMTTKVTISDSVQKALGKLGVSFTEKPSDCTVLITDGIGRTEKFLCAMGVVRHIVTIKWAEDSARLKKILPPDDYALQDPEGEKKFGFKLADALKRARSSDKKLLQGHTFYVTPAIRNGDKFETYKRVAASAGAKISTQTPTTRILDGHDDRHVMSSLADQSIWRGLADEGFPVYSPELLLMGVLKQKMDWANNLFRLDKNA